ncbi:helix-turn-helix domain-containing protein [Nocardia farcinica]|uniref:helix-turn-helix domain-containing protein n=1 Tax=Nocardia farcinica TaxID=37329 RepID=UPI000BF7E98B|nr:helix-turn-helix transcriptional regulator [Nocardia farcinica]
MPDTGDPPLAAIIKAYMSAHGISTHDEMARVLGVERSLVSKYISGARRCRDIAQLRRFADAMDLPAEALGLLNTPAGLRTQSDDIRQWQFVRQSLNRNRYALTTIAARMYWDAERIENTTCLTKAGWIAESPVELAAVELEFDGEVNNPLLSGTEIETESVRPVRADGTRFERYSQAIRTIARPTLFENRTSYRPMDARFGRSHGRLRFGLTTYFDMVDVCEALAHETAAAWLSRTGTRRLEIGDLPFRRHIGDLFDTTRRAILPSIYTLTVRRGHDGATFFLHRRGTTSVTLAPGLSHIIPAGVFQPAAIGPWNIRRDFDLWRNMIREFFEEFMDAAEHDGSRGTSIDYEADPYRSLSLALNEGRVKAWCFGIGFDPLTPAGEILTVAVFDADVFDEVFTRMALQNAEGELYPSDPGTVGIRFTSANVRRILNHEPLAAAAAACIALAWKHRQLLVP